MPPTRGSRTLGYALLGLWIGLALFAVVYLVTVRGDLAQPTTSSWLLIFLGTLLLPVLIGAAMGSREPKAEGY